MNYKIKILLNKVNKHIETIKEQNDTNDALSKLNHLKKLLTRKNKEATVQFSGQLTLNNILDNQNYNHLVDQLSKFHLSRDNFIEYLNKNISYFENNIEEQAKGENYFIYKKYQELLKLVKSKPEIKKITINISENLSTQIADIYTQIEKDPDVKFREEVVASIRRKLELPTVNSELESQKNDNLLYFNSEIKPNLTNTGPIVITLKELDDIASIKVNSLYKDLYGDKGINAQILKMYKENTAKQFKKLLAEIKLSEKNTNSLKNGNKQLKTFNNAVELDLKLINILGISDYHLNTLPEEQFPKFYNKFINALHTKDDLEKEYAAWKYMQKIIRSLPPEKIATIQISYDPRTSMEFKKNFIKESIEEQLGKPIKYFLTSNGPKTPGGGSDFR